MAEAGVAEGTVNLVSQHTTVGLTINENEARSPSGVWGPKTRAAPEKGLQERATRGAGRADSAEEPVGLRVQKAQKCPTAPPGAKKECHSKLCDRCWRLFIPHRQKLGRR